MLKRYGVLLVEHWFVVLMVLLGVLAVRRIRTLSQTLEAKVEARTKELRHSNAILLQSADAARTADHAKTVFLANMSHEMRTPLNAVLGYTSLLLDTPLSTAQLEQLQAVHTAADVLLSQLNTILDLAKVDSNKLEVEYQPTDLLLAMEDAIEILADKARQKALSLTCLLSADCPRYITTDPGRLRQVLINLLGNAIKFTDRGEVVILALRHDGAPQPQVRFEVTDTGQGIPAHSLPALFNPAPQGDGSLPRRPGGPGPGLAICRHIVEAMGGRIGAQSRPGEGAKFWFSLPLVRTRPSAPGQLELPVRTHGRRVLVVDGHAASRAQLDQLLSDLHLVPVLCPDAASVRSTLAASPNLAPIAVLIASSLPDAEVQQLTAEIKQFPKLETTPVVLLASGGERVAMATPLPAGFASLLLKPIRTRTLVRVLQELLGESAERRVDLARTGQLGSELMLASPPRLLVVEDNPANQRLAVLMLQVTGCRIDVAANGREAVSAAMRVPYDLIFMDCQMPELDGHAATREIRRLPPPICQVPIVALTAGAFAKDRERSLAAGMSDFLSKPMTVDGMLRMLKRWIPVFQKAVEAPPSLVRPPQSEPPQSEPPLSGASALQDDLASMRRRRQELTTNLGGASAEAIVSLFQKDVWERLDAAVAELQSDDLVALQRTAHRLAGSALQVGAAALAQRCRQLETVAQRADSTAAARLLSDLDGHLQGLIMAL